MSAKFIRGTEAKGQIVTAATFTSSGTDEINKDRHALNAEV
jgi:hypothetical protein